MEKVMLREIIEAELKKLRAMKYEGIIMLKKQDGSIVVGKVAHILLRKIIKELKILLASQVTPPNFYSFITGKTYTADPQEPLIHGDLKPALFYLFPIKHPKNPLTFKTNSTFALYHENGEMTEAFHLEHKENKNYPHGSFSQKVKQGFIFNQRKPKYAVKVFKQNLFDGNTDHELRIGMRASYCARLLGNTGFTFRSNHKQYFVTDWHPGFPLSNIEFKSVKATSITLRIRLALDLIHQVALLNRKNIIHTDIKPDNIIISDTSIHLIDLDSVRLQGEPPLGPLIRTEAYLSSQLYYEVLYNPKAYKKFNQESDLRALVLSLTFLFPDLLEPHPITQKVTLPNSSETFKHHTLTHQRGSGYNSHLTLARLLESVIYPNDHKKILSASSLFEKVLYLYQHVYKQVYFIKANQIEPDIEHSGEEAFEQIDTELMQYSFRKKLFEQRVANLQANPPKESSNASSQEEEGDTSEDSGYDEDSESPDLPDLEPLSLSNQGHKNRLK